jgi:hypothetical protein
MAYSGNRFVASRNPYPYMLQGNVNLNILGFIDAPFTFLYSNLDNKYTQPTINQSCRNTNKDLPQYTSSK